MSFNIALHTTQIPTVISPTQEVIAIIELTRDRATELLELMDEITLRACLSSTTYKTSSFESSALYVPAYALSQLPSPGDFIVLPHDYIVTAVTPIKLVHANVFPLFVTWTATQKDDQFTVNSTEIDAEILKIAARGETLPTGSTYASVENSLKPSPCSFIKHETDWLN